MFSNKIDSLYHLSFIIKMETCGICDSSTNSLVAIYTCKHIICINCSSKCNVCPYCRTKKETPENPYNILLNRFPQYDTNLLNIENYVINIDLLPDNKCKYYGCKKRTRYINIVYHCFGFDQRDFALFQIKNTHPCTIDIQNKYIILYLPI